MKTPLQNSRPTSILATRISALVAAVLVPALTGLAATSIWTGVTDGNWITANNWSPSGVPGTSGGTANQDTVLFNNAVNTAIAIDAARNIKFITFDTGAGAFTFSGGSLVTSANSIWQINPGAANSETINSAVTLNGSAMSFLNNSSTAGVLFSFGGNITGSGTNALTLGGSGNGVVSGVIANGTGTVSINKTGGGIWTLSGANTYTGNTTLSGGTLKLDFSAAGAPATNIIANTSPLAVAGTSTLTLTGATGGTNSQTFASTSFASGLASINVNPGTGGTMALNLGAITGNTGSLVRFSGTGTVAGTMANTSTGGVMGSFGQITGQATAVNAGFATVGLTDYAAINAGAVVSGATVSGFYTATAPSSSTSVGNWDATTSVSLGTGQRAATTTRFNTAAALTTTLCDPRDAECRRE